MICGLGAPGGTPNTRNARSGVPPRGRVVATVPRDGGAIEDSPSRTLLHAMTIRSRAGGRPSAQRASIITAFTTCDRPTSLGRSDRTSRLTSSPARPGRARRRSRRPTTGTCPQMMSTRRASTRSAWLLVDRAVSALSLNPGVRSVWGAQGRECLRAPSFSERVGRASTN